MISIKNRYRKNVGTMFLLAGVAVLAGCSIQSAGLVPTELPPVEQRIEKTLKVMPVLGGRGSTFGREAYITNEQYHTAILETMNKSGLFRNTVESGDADLELHSEIITITTESGLSPTYAIVVQYWLTGGGLAQGHQYAPSGHVERSLRWWHPYHQGGRGCDAKKSDSAHSGSRSRKPVT